MALYLETSVKEFLTIFSITSQVTPFFLSFFSLNAFFKLIVGMSGFFFSVYDVSGAASDRNCVVLSDIHIDIMDYIQPASCTDAEFRQMWAEFEWENKVNLRG